MYDIKLNIPFNVRQASGLLAMIIYKHKIISMNM